MKSRAIYYYSVLGALLSLSGCNVPTGAAGCRVDAASEHLPAVMPTLRLGMTRAQLEQRMGAADYSPSAGVFYFSTGGDCLVEGTLVKDGLAEDSSIKNQFIKSSVTEKSNPADAPVRTASCGLVADFNDQRGTLQRQLQSCWWGAIAE